MEDKEVGKLWMVNRIPTAKGDELHLLQQEAICDLIRKLVEERYESYDLAGHPTPLDDVLGEFGIDRETWSRKIK